MSFDYCSPQVAYKNKEPMQPVFDMWTYNLLLKQLPCRGSHASARHLVIAGSRHQKTTSPLFEDTAADIEGHLVLMMIKVCVCACVCVCVCV